MAYKFAVTEENCFLNGTGQNQPLGVMTVSAHGLDTDRDFTSSITANFSADDIISLVYELKSQYRNSGTCAFILARATEKKIRLMKSGDGQFLWQPGLQAGAPAMLAGFPCYTSEYMNSTYSSGNYVMIFGDFSQYVIVDSLLFRIQKLTELYAETNQYGYIGRQECDGMPVDKNGFIRLKLK